MANKQVLQSAGDGTAVPAGYVGEVKTFTERTTTGTNGTVVSNTTALVNLTAGVWLVCSRCTFTPSTSLTNLKSFVATNSTVDFSGIIAQVDLGFSYTATTEPTTISLATQEVLYVPSSQDLFAKSYSAGIARNVTIRGFAVRIA